MPVTQGHGNPDWNRDETILALDLLYKHGKPVDRKHIDVSDLSDLLRRARFHPVENRTDRFRNPDGVALKLQNLFSAVEPGRGLSYSKTDLQTVTDFPRSESIKLAALANAIRSTIGEQVVFNAVYSDDEETFVEGRWLTVRHRHRDSRLRKKLLEAHRSKVLKCEVCDFSPPAFDRKTQESFFEAHHEVPIAAAEGLRSTRVSDMALLCASCHRFIHRMIAQRRTWTTIAEARACLDLALLESGRRDTTSCGTPVHEKSA
jgi:5-methylcytosine-specific restriction protein A